MLRGKFMFQKRVIQIKNSFSIHSFSITWLLLTAIASQTYM